MQWEVVCGTKPVPLQQMSTPPHLCAHVIPEVGKVTIKINGDEALSDESA
jgi:hypothetical protein